MRSRLLLLLALAPLALPALAEDSNVRLDAPGLLSKKGPAKAPDVKAAPQAWPRLDPGSALCRSEADLARLAANRARAEGGGPADCKIMRVATAVQVVLRASTGRTQVRLTDQPTTTGWTDVWLPEKAPGAR